MSWRGIAAACLAMSWLVCLLSGARAGAMQPFRLQLNWLPQAEFMGFYVANAKGLYEHEGIDIKLIPGGPGIVPSEAIRDGRADAIIEWMPDAYHARRQGVPLINVAQIFASSGLILVCHRDHGIYGPDDLRGRKVMVWPRADKFQVVAWLASLGLSSGPKGSDVELIDQGRGVDGFFNGAADCISAMSYNEYGDLLERGAKPAEMTIFRYQDYGFSLLEDGIYVDARRLKDPSFRALLVRFLKASIAGWRDAVAHPGEAAFIVSKIEPDVDLAHETRMAEQVVRLVGPPAQIGLLRLSAYDHTLALLAGHVVSGAGFGRGRFWTHRFWDEATGQAPGMFSREVRYRLTQVLASPWFYVLDLIGTFAFGTAGFLRACERRYDFWGAFILTLLPAVGGGTLRDLLIGGERSPPFIFRDPTYVYIVIAIVVVGFPLARYARFPRALARQFGRVLLLTDTIGLTAFAIIGASVAIRTGLAWFWIPFCAGLTCAGGGLLLDVVTGREPRTFRGEPYEELAIVGGLLLTVLLHFAGDVEFVTGAIVAAVAFTFVFVFVLRYLVVLRGWRVPLLGRHAAPPAG